MEPTQSFLSAHDAHDETSAALLADDRGMGTDSKMGNSYFLLALRLYHVWCMFVGLLMVMAMALQVVLAIYIEFYSSTWVLVTENSGVALCASVAMSIVILDVGTSMCYSAVWLMRDAWRVDSFLGFRSALLLRPLHVRIAVAAPTKSGEDWGRSAADIIVQLLIIVPLDIFPIIGAIISWLDRDIVGDVRDRGTVGWQITIASVALAEVCVFWLAEVVHDYVYKAEALWKLIQRFSAPGSEPPPELPPAVPESSYRMTPSVELSIEMQTLRCVPTGLPQTGNLCELVRRKVFLRPWFSLLGLVLLWAVTALSFSQVLLFTTLALTCLATIHCFSECFFTRYHCIRIKVETLQDRQALCDCIDDDFNMTNSCVGKNWTVFAGYQLISDGFLSTGQVRRQLSQYPLGSMLTFRQEAMGPLQTFIEVHCGASPELLTQNAVLIIFLGLACCLALFWLEGPEMAFACLAALALYIFPAACVFIVPRFAAMCHVVVSLLVALTALVVGMIAAEPGSIIFWTIPFVILASHCLLHRRLQYMVLITASFTLLFAIVVALFFSVSMGASLQNAFTPHHYPMASNFTFPKQGAQTRQGAPAGALITACGLTYPSSDPNRSLSIIDFSWFNKLVYEPDVSLREQLKLWMPDWNLIRSRRREIRCKDAKHCNHLHDWASWFVFEGKEGTGLENTTIVTIRGTKSQLEVILDLDLWSLQILGLQRIASNFPGVGPVVNGFWNSPVVGRGLYSWKKERYAEVRDYVRDRLAKEPHRFYYLSGHSLGGGLAQLISAELLEIPAVTFSSPGTIETAQVLGLKPDNLQGRVVNIVPKSDPIPLGGGTHGGTVINVPCITTGFSCHRVFNLVCELMRECGDQHQRVLPCSFCSLQSQRTAPERCGGKKPTVESEITV